MTVHSHSGITFGSLAAVGCLLLLGASVRVGRSHDSPEHVVEALTHRMETSGVTPDLLVRRATEWRVLHRFDAAASDLLQALSLDPGHLEARGMLGRVYLAQGNGASALATLQEALEQAGDAPERFSLLMVRAEVHRFLGHSQQALADCQKAMESPRIPLDWYLMRSRMQAETGQTRQAVDGLRAGMERTGSFVLETEWIETLIDDGQHQAALTAIQPQLEASRWKSAWLVRRARARLGLGLEPQARADLQEALEEMEMRHRRVRPDVMTLADRGLARALLGDAEGARNDLEEARQSGGDHWLLHRLETQLAAARWEAEPSPGFPPTGARSLPRP